MAQTRPRLGRYSLVLAIAMLVALGAAAPAALAGSVSYDGGYIVYEAGDNDSHDVQIRRDGTGTRHEIFDSEDFAPEDIPSDCTYPTSLDSQISCPGHAGVRFELGSGNDSVTSALDCFFDYIVNLGEGTNDNDMNDGCPDAATATITSGSGDDVLRGGSASTALTFFAGGGDDSVFAGPIDDILHGGEGADRLFGREGNDQVLGEGGNDEQNGGEGNDLVDGGTGDDGLEHCSDCIGLGNDAGVGADTYTGGPGADKLWLDGHAAGMAISIDGQANDGSPGEGDNVGSDIEVIAGTVHNDVFTGSAGNDNFEGSGGSDEMHGAGGDDDLYGGSGDDRVFGDAGNDKVQGASDSDSVDGGAGLDAIYGDIASCSVFCNFDPDTLFARDGERDTVDCGAGADSAQVDQFDVVAFCASVDRQTTAPPPGGGGPGGGPGAGLAKASFAGSKRTLKVNRRGRFSYSFRAGAGLRGKAVFRKLAKKSFKVPSSGKVRLKVALSRKKLALLRRSRRIKTKVTVTLRDGAGGSSVASTRVTLKL